MTMTAQQLSAMVREQPVWEDGHTWLMTVITNGLCLAAYGEVQPEWFCKLMADAVIALVTDIRPSEVEQ